MQQQPCCPDFCHSALNLKGGTGNLSRKIPNTMKPADAAPLLCAGITVWSPIAKYVTKPGMKVCFAFCIIAPHVTMVVVPLPRSCHPSPNNTSFKHEGTYCAVEQDAPCHDVCPPATCWHHCLVTHCQTCQARHQGRR